MNRKRRQLALLLTFAVTACSAGPPREPPHGMVLVVLDTMRADGLSCYGNPRPTSPALDGLAERGVLFEQAISNAPWTLPGFVGLLSGSYSSRRVFAKGKLRVGLVENLREAGYATVAFTEGGFVSSHYGFDRGFEQYHELEGKIARRRPGVTPGVTPELTQELTQEGKQQSNSGGSTESTFDAAIEWLRENHDRPFFLLLHTYEAHVPYLRRTYAKDLPRGVLGPTYGGRDPKRVKRRELAVGKQEVAYVRALYDGGVRAADEQVGRLLTALAELGIADQTVVVATADHGETLGERDTQLLGVHGERVYDELLHVPLIIYDPRFDYPVSRVSSQVRLVDVLPTLLDLAGAEPPTATDGSSLLPLMLGTESEDRLAFSDGDPVEPNESRRTAVRDGRYKLIANVAPRPPGLSKSEFYDLESDPGERENLAGVPSEARTRLAALLEKHWVDRGGIRHGRLEMPDEVPAELTERLKALGYLDE